MAAIYQVLEFDSLFNLEKEVNLLLSEGWQLAGGVSAVSYPTVNDENENAISFYQALTKTD